MLYHVKGKFKGTVWRMKYCDRCGQLVDHKCKDVVVVDAIVDESFPGEAIEYARTKPDQMAPYTWIELPTATLVPTDRVMRSIGAPMLPGMQL